MLKERLDLWEAKISDFALPAWEQLPELELYMDQVVLLISGYLARIPATPESDKAITASIVNNYVRMKIMPAPVKKKYSRIHLAYLIMICTLKQSMSIASIQKLMPLSLTEDGVRETYEAFVKQNAMAARAFLRYLKTEVPKDFTLDSLPVCAASVAGLAKSLTEYLLYQEKNDEADTKKRKSER